MVSIPTGEFTRFMQAYQDMVFATVARLVGNDSQAQDIAQDVFLKAYENFAHLRSSSTAGGWLKTVAAHRALNYLSRHRNRWRLFSELRGAEDDEYEPQSHTAIFDTPFAALDGDERRTLVDRALRQLPEHQRVPLVLYHFEAMSYEEIAARLHVSLAKVKVDIHRARTALARSLTRAGITDGSAD